MNPKSIRVSSSNGPGSPPHEEGKFWLTSLFFRDLTSTRVACITIPFATSGWGGLQTGTNASNKRMRSCSFYRKRLRELWKVGSEGISFPPWLIYDRSS